MMAWLTAPSWWGLERWRWLVALALIVGGAALYAAAFREGGLIALGALLVGIRRRRVSLPDPLEVVRARSAELSRQVDEEVQQARAAEAAGQERDRRARVDEEAVTERLRRMSDADLDAEMERTRRPRR